MAKNSEQMVNVNDVSRIAEGVVMKGDISSPTDIRIDGQVEGKIYSQSRIVVGETAVLKGSMLCGDTDFWGRMDGDIYVRDVLTLKSSAVVNGSVHVRKLQVEMGAQINGSCKMITESEFDQLADNLVSAKIKSAAPVSRKAREVSPIAAFIKPKEVQTAAENQPLAN